MKFDHFHTNEYNVHLFYHLPNHILHIFDHFPANLYNALKEYPEDEYIYKGCGDYIVVMKLLKDSITNKSRANIINANYAKHRTNKVKVILIINKFTLEIVNNVENSHHEKKLKYIVNEIIEVKDYDMDLNNVCCAGIHYFKKIKCAFYFILNAELYTGHSIKWYENGQKCEESNYVDGKRNGHFTSWYRNGQKCIERDHIDDKYNGHYTSWHKNGQIMIECDYVDGKVNGVIQVGLKMVK